MYHNRCHPLQHDQVAAHLQGETVVLVAPNRFLPQMEHVSRTAHQYTAALSLGTPRTPNPLHWLVFVRGWVVVCVYVCSFVYSSSVVLCVGVALKL